MDQREFIDYYNKIYNAAIRFIEKASTVEGVLSYGENSEMDGLDLDFVNDNLCAGIRYIDSTHSAYDYAWCGVEVDILLDERKTDEFIENEHKVYLEYINRESKTSK